MMKSRSSSRAHVAAAQPLPTAESVRRRARHRLLGATVVTVLTVVGLMLLLDTEPPAAQGDVVIEIPSQDNAAPLNTQRIEQAIANAPEVPPQTSAESQAATVELPPPAPPADVPEPAEPPKAAAAPAEQPPVDAPKPSKSAQPKSPPRPSQATAPDPQRDAARAQALLEGKPVQTATPRVVVQVGAFSDAARAQQVRLKLERAGLKTYVHIAQTADGPRIRVRVGPFASKAQAQDSAERVKALGLPATVLTL